MKLSLDEHDYVGLYIEKFGSFNSDNLNIDDPSVIEACKKALKENRKVTTEELYPGYVPGEMIL